MKINIKFNHDDPYNFSRNKLIRAIWLILGTFWTLLGGCGLIIDLFFPSVSNTYHNIAGESNIGRLLAGLLFLGILFYFRSIGGKKKST
ncbi:hypothetical protein [Chitinophaga sp. GbtcB8]|uniref:hypothetical protein n=1 Tax=Chitinophaga sp. GbtcB8 TaxID=2824753 RepID=UPI001C2F9FDC|nr:hypothetical protein [Chitinophaga sp. GbtcB8]